jgi:hypothetical protein
MHKNIPVADMRILPDTGRIVKLFSLHAPEHLPLGVMNQDGVMSRRAIDDWWTGRSIPASRDGIAEALEHLGNPSFSVLAYRCYGLSLSDQYWICPKGSGLKWEDVNFFHNGFSKDMGEILFGRGPSDSSAVSLMSPDNTSDGWLRKKWIIMDGKHSLMKGGSGDYQQEPFNEVIACAVMRRLSIPHVNYTLTFDGGKPYSLCENFITPDTELIPASRVKGAFKKDNRDSGFTHLLRCCDALGIPGVLSALGKMLVLDYIISNEDRHYNNFGFVRNAETLEWLGLAPVYDSGTSLWYSTRFVGRETECKPFQKTHASQIKLVSSLSWYDADALLGIGGECAEILSRSGTVDGERRASLAAMVAGRSASVGKMKGE